MRVRAGTLTPQLSGAALPQALDPMSTRFLGVPVSFFPILSLFPRSRLYSSKKCPIWSFSNSVLTLT